ncbi:LytR family transcriptional regulator, partial [Streptomyces sp. NPDC047072]
FLTVPRESYIHDRNRDQLAQPAARRLFERLRKDAPVTVTEDEPKLSGISKNRESFQGSTAAEDVCG